MPGQTDAIEKCPCLIALDPQTVACSTRSVPALGDNEYRAKVDISLVSPGTELHRIQGTHTQKTTYPRATGYISTGRIVGAGKDADPALIGSRVLLHQGHIAYHNVPVGRTTPIPDGVESVDAAATVMLAIALRGVRGGQVRFGDSTLVVGLGVVGLFTAHLAKLAGAFPVIGVDPLPNRRQIGLSLGVDVALDPTAVDLQKEIKAATGGEGTRVSIDATGTTRILPTLPALTAEFGRVVVLGGVHGTVALDLYSDFQKRNQTMVGCGSPHPTDYPFDEHRNEHVLLSMIRAGIVRPRPVITHVRPWQEAPEMYAKLMSEKDKVIGLAFDWGNAA